MSETAARKLEELKAAAAAHLKAAETALAQVRLTSRRKRGAVGAALNDVRAALFALNADERRAHGLTGTSKGPLDSYFRPSAPGAPS